MVFATTSLFKGINCPQSESCTLTNCIFAHDHKPKSTSLQFESEPQRIATTAVSTDNGGGPPLKRRRVTYDKAEDSPPSKADLIRSELTQSRTAAKAAPSSLSDQGVKAPQSLKRSVSPPAKTNTKATLSTTTEANNNSVDSKATLTHDTTSQQKLDLNPRLISNDPAGHAKRSVYLKHLHGEMVRLNTQLVERKDVHFKVGLTLQTHELVQLAVDEEETLAREHGGVYGNVVKNRIGAYRKMKSDEWIVHIKSTPVFVKKQSPSVQRQAAPDPPKVIDTGLSPMEEVAVAAHLVVDDQKLLAQFGYVPAPPTPEQAAEAAAAVEASWNYEICDRCTSRFQVYPQRNADGLLTSNGDCRHHPNRKIFPQRTKADTGPKEPYYPCCNEAVGSAGCAVTEHHVFKASSPARLAAVMPFCTTPENNNPARTKRGKEVKVVAFDCEMGYTTLGLELIRLTAVSWPEGEELADVLVRPFGIILDLNSRFSGVWPEDMARAIPPPPTSLPPQLDGFADHTPTPPPPGLPIVDSPYKARDLLCSFLTPTTPLIGHAIENDLNVVRLCHPTIIDTVIAFPHPRGLPLRYGLKILCSKYLGRAIQQGGERGHDSLEDSRATGDLVRVKVGEKWKLLRATEWSFVQGRLVGPEVPGEGRRGSEGGLGESLMDKAINGERKRKKRGAGVGADGEEGGSLASFLERSKDVGAATDGKLSHELSVAYLEDETIGSDN
ncbi:RNA exonuclease 3 [Friedmanniomyces endolithicus]|nr:RNA exonuclease 3 [Friedmanniomyces endolithicus]KAK1820356.1 RNA exonuclease 3 [Friedmanniomyces endolithicus]